MALRPRRSGYYLALVVVTTAVFTVAYNVGMATWEGRPQLIYRSLEVVIQSFTTTGYGEDAPWRSPQMNALAIVMQFTSPDEDITEFERQFSTWSPTAPEGCPPVLPVRARPAVWPVSG